MRAPAILALFLAACSSGATPVAPRGPGPDKPAVVVSPVAPKPTPVRQVHKTRFQGDQANYLLTTLQNKDTKLAHHRRKVTFVAIWASF